MEFSAGYRVKSNKGAHRFDRPQWRRKNDIIKDNERTSEAG
ncbi:hypothetical protein QKW52_02390 [Bacillus sonorensis]|nr:hypothetical protein [Bacillus sonorensis]